MNSGIYLLLGTNLGNRYNNLKEARYKIDGFSGKIIRESSIYHTAAWGVTNEPAYLNQVVQIDSDLNPEDLLRSLLNTETSMGRIRQQKWQSRIIDIDILFYHQVIIETQNISIPHPRLHERNFTLVPLSEIAPDLIHPAFQKSIQDLLNECTDTLAVSKYIFE